MSLKTPFSICTWFLQEKSFECRCRCAFLICWNRVPVRVYIEIHRKQGLSWLQAPRRSILQAMQACFRSNHGRADMKAKAQKFHTVGNVTYLGSSPGAPSGESHPCLSRAESMAGGEDFTPDEQTAIRRLESSFSGTWTPARLRSKIHSLGFSGEKVELILGQIMQRKSYDALWAATREVQRRLKKGQGERLLHRELTAAGFDADVISEALQAVSEEEWHEALDIAMQSSSIRSKEGTALKQALLRRGFLTSQIQSFLSKRKGSR